MKPITVCFTYFKSLTLVNLAAALYSVRQQDLSQVEEIVIVDNDTSDAEKAIADIVSALDFLVPVRLLSLKHGDVTKTHSWSTNFAVRCTGTPWVLFTRADYLLGFDLVKRFAEYIELVPEWNGFITSNGCHLGNGIDDCERTGWRQVGPRIFQGSVFDYTLIDAGVWMARREAFDKIGGLDEQLTAWGHAQTDFQYRLHRSAVEFVRIPEVLFWHPAHGGEKDIELAHRQLAERGGDLKAMWARYEGEQPYE